ncbi:MAG: hypothetical protein JWP97_1085 [Labilithrix sp.]|nr:hypothetical protein [Labilithrix sp.]
MSVLRSVPRVRRVAATLGSSLALVAMTLAACGGEEPVVRSPATSIGRKDPASLREVALTCAKVVSCTHAHDVPRLKDPGACVESWLGAGGTRDPLQKCLAQASSCAQIETCMHGAGDSRAAAFCAARPGVVSGCDGERLVSCGDDDAQESTVIDCAALGASCRELRSSGGLVLRACFAPQKCPPGAPEARCDGEGAVLGCHDGAIERASCSPGTKCIEHKDDAGEATASCELPGRRRCGLLGARQCDGDRLVECAGQERAGKVTVTDCAAQGLRCTGTGPRAGCYVPADVECDKEMLPKCDDGGRSLVFCAAGRTTKVSCGAIGMGPCNPTAHGAVAACSPQ